MSRYDQLMKESEDVSLPLATRLSKIQEAARLLPVGVEARQSTYDKYWELANSTSDERKVSEKSFLEKKSSELGGVPRELLDLVGKEFSYRDPSQYYEYNAADKPLKLTSVYQTEQGPLLEFDNGLRQLASEQSSLPLYGFTPWRPAPPPPKKKSGLKGFVSDVVGGALNLGGDILKPFGLEEYAAPIIGAGITAASGGTLGTLGAAIAGGAFAGGAEPIAAGDFSAGLKGAALGGVAGGIGGALSTVNPVTSLGAKGNLIANQAVQGGIGGAAGGLLTGQDPIKSGLLGAATSGAVTAGSVGLQSLGNAIGDAIGTPVQKPVTADLSKSIFETDATGVPRQTVGLLGDDVRVTEPGISPRFNVNNPNAINALDPDFSLGVKPNTTSATTLPYLGGMGDGVGLVSTVHGANGQPLAFQGVNGVARPGFTTAIGDISSPINDPNLLGKDVVQAGQVKNAGITAPVTSRTSDELSQRLLAGLLSGGAVAAGVGLLGVGGGQMQQAPQTRPLTQFQINPQVNQYTGDFNTFGERGSQGFRFYNAPVTGLLG